MKRKNIVVPCTIMAIVLVVFGRTSMAEPEKGRLYVIGTGPAGPQTATLQALESMARMDAIAASQEHVRLFSDYIGAKVYLFDPWKCIFEYRGKPLPELRGMELRDFIQERSRLIESRVGLIRGLLEKGKNVGLLDSGNPLLFAPGNWYLEKFAPQDVVIIPGMGSDAAAMAALGKSVLPANDARFILQSSPFYLMDHRTGGTGMIEDLSKYPATMILYIALQMPDRLFKLLGAVYPPDMPCAVVFWAGYPDRERVLKGTIGDMGTKLKDEPEGDKDMGLLLIGRFLGGRPYEAAMASMGDRK